MANPVTGPFLFEITQPNRLWIVQQKWRQKPPYNIVLPYFKEVSYVVDYHGYPATFSMSEPQPPEVVGVDTWNLLSNQAYARLMDDINGEKSQLAATLLEFEQSATMIANRAVQLARFFRAVKRFDLAGVKAALSINPSRKVWDKAEKHARKKDLAGLVLEVDYGWLPLAADIYNATQVLAFKNPKVRCKGSARLRGVWKDEKVNIITNTFQQTKWSIGYREMRVRQGAEVWVDNPNWYYANQLGLVNLGSALWEITYMSHVVDWFTGIGAVIGSFTDLCGLGINNAYTTKFCMSNLEVTGDFLATRAFTSDPWTTHRNRDYGMEYAWMKRSTGLTAPVITFRWGIKSWTRMLNAVSQLVQVLPSK